MKSRGFFILLLISSCSHRPHYPLQIKSYQDDTISIQSGLDLAMSSYLFACVNTHKAYGKKGVYKQCREEAEQHVRENIQFILDQQGSQEDIDT